MSIRPTQMVGRVVEIRAVGPPNRRLDFRIELRNDSSEKIVILRSEISATVGNVSLAAGDFLRIHYPGSGPFALSSGETSHVVDLRVPISREALALIESRRSGDIEYQLRADVFVAPIIERSIHVLGSPEERMVSGPNFNAFGNGKIPQSQWLELLRTMGWDETVLLEIPYSAGRQPHHGALQRWEEAVQHYRMGAWEDCLVACRRMFESLAWLKTPEGATKAEMPRLREFFDGSDKGKHLDTMTTHFQSFLHLGRHEPGTTGVRIDRDDALLALTISASLLRYTARRS